MSPQCLRESAEFIIRFWPPWIDARVRRCPPRQSYRSVQYALRSVVVVPCSIFSRSVRPSFRPISPYLHSYCIYLLLPVPHYPLPPAVFHPCCTASTRLRSAQLQIWSFPNKLSVCSGSACSISDPLNFWSLRSFSDHACSNVAQGSARIVSALSFVPMDTLLISL